jgi:hypothetical protein
MTTLSRLVALLIGVAIGACQFLPWSGSATAMQIPLRSLVSPGQPITTSWIASMAVPLTVASLLAVLGALWASRTLLVIAGLTAIAFPSAWILVNVLSDEAGLDIAAVGMGAYGAAVAGFLLLVLAAVASDTKAPSLR